MVKVATSTSQAAKPWSIGTQRNATQLNGTTIEQRPRPQAVPKERIGKATRCNGTQPGGAPVFDTRPRHGTAPRWLFCSTRTNGSGFAEQKGPERPRRVFHRTKRLHPLATKAGAKTVATVLEYKYPSREQPAQSIDLAIGCLLWLLSVFLPFDWSVTFLSQAALSTASPPSVLLGCGSKLQGTKRVATVATT